MTLPLKSKKVLITDATSGLGKLLAFDLAKQGCDVIIHGRVEAIEFMLTRSSKVNIKRLDLINHLQQ